MMEITVVATPERVRGMGSSLSFQLRWIFVSFFFERGGELRVRESLADLSSPHLPARRLSVW